jgi:hypothetical protein
LTLSTLSIDESDESRQGLWGNQSSHPNKSTIGKPGDHDVSPPHGFAKSNSSDVGSRHSIICSFLTDSCAGAEFRLRHTWAKDGDGDTGSSEFVLQRGRE